MAGWSVALLLVGVVACGRSNAAEDDGRLDRSTRDPWIGARLADFRMQSSTGKTVTLKDLSGPPFVLDFVFTTCAGPCPLMSSGMLELQKRLGSSKVRLVSVSVDPQTDSLEVLGRYAERYGADPERWLFLRGEDDEVAALAKSVDLPVSREADAQIGFQVAHSTRLIVVDGEGRVRGYYPGTTPEGIEAALARVTWLESR